MLRNGSDVYVLIGGALAFVLVLILSCSRVEEPETREDAAAPPIPTPMSDYEALRRGGRDGSAVFTWELAPGAAELGDTVAAIAGDPRAQAAGFFAEFARLPEDHRQHWYRHIRLSVVGEHGDLICLALHADLWRGPEDHLRRTRYHLVDRATGRESSWRDWLGAVSVARLQADLGERLHRDEPMVLGPQAVGFDEHGILVQLDPNESDHRLCLPWSTLTFFIQGEDERNGHAIALRSH